MPSKDILKNHFKASDRKLIIYYWSPNDADGFEKWMNKTRLDMKVMKKIIAQLTIYSKNGLPRKNREKFRHVEDKICELKPTVQVRLLGFDDHPDFIVVCMDVKKTDKLSPALIASAQKLRSLYYEKKK
ncbi:MAG: type II toxin-antitoxin system RelE/ParE family toxin [Desulfoplanes sp.]